MHWDGKSPAVAQVYLNKQTGSLSLTLGGHESVCFLAKRGWCAGCVFLLPKLINNRTREVTGSSGKIQPVVFFYFLWTPLQTADSYLCQLRLTPAKLLIWTLQKHARAEKSLRAVITVTSAPSVIRLLWFWNGRSSCWRKGNAVVAAGDCWATAGNIQNK